MGKKSFRGGTTYRKCSPQCVQTGYRLANGVRGDFCCLTDGCNHSRAHISSAFYSVFNVKEWQCFSAITTVVPFYLINMMLI